MQAETELFLNRLERLQAKLLLTQAELLRKISLSKAQLSNIRNGKHPVSVKVLRRLAAAEAEHVSLSRQPSPAVELEPQAHREPEVDRLSQAISELERQVAALREERTAEKAAIDARRTALDAEFAAQPGVADALAAGLSHDEIRALFRAEITRRRAKGELPPAPKAHDPELAAAERDLQKAKAQGKFKDAAHPGQKNRSA